MIAPARRMAFDILQRIDLGNAFTDVELGSPKVDLLDSRDRGLLTEIVYGTQRWRLLLDHLLSKTSSIAWEKVDPRIRTLLRLSLYQMWHMERTPDHAVVSNAVDLAKRTCLGGASGFVNGILRNLGRQRPWSSSGYESAFPDWVRVSLPQWIWERWSSRYGDEMSAAYARSLCEAPRCSFWVNEAVNTADPVAADSAASEFVPHARLSEVSVSGPSIWVQDEASQLVPHLFGAGAGWKIWDTCACPGGKSAILKKQCGRSGKVISSDRLLRRARRMAAVFGSFFGESQAILVCDASRAPVVDKSFDAVLADVPCSGLGTLRRNPEIKWRFLPHQFTDLQNSQRSILDSASAAVRVGGTLLYSTCSTEPEENERVIDWFLASRPDFRLIRPGNPPNVESWLDERGFLRTFPSTRLWDGFFAALMIRVS